MLDTFKGLIEAGSEEASLLQSIDSGKIPSHVAVIMDGNGRWAKAQGQQRVEGHRKGAATARLITETAARLGIKYLTLYAFSSENWKRPVTEVNALMDMLYENMVTRRDLLMDNKIRLKVIGDLKRLPGKLKRKLQETEDMTAGLERMQINLALNYGSRSEIVQAVKGMLEDGIKPSKVNEGMLSQYLYTGGCPDPDLVIRTSGERRISNFLLFQIAYAELYFTDVFWPDFGIAEFFNAIIDFQHRKRRFGSI